MRFLNLGLMFVLSTPHVWASDGKEARVEASRYPANAQPTQLSIGAHWLTAEQIRQSFSAELQRSVLVVEVAVYPEGGRSIDVSRSAFTIRPTGSDKSSKPLHPAAAAQTAEQRSGEGLETNVYQQVGIGYERGRVSDPATGQERKESSVYTSTGACGHWHQRRPREDGKGPRSDGTRAYRKRVARRYCQQTRGRLSLLFSFRKKEE